MDVANFLIARDVITEGRRFKLPNGINHILRNHGGKGVRHDYATWVSTVKVISEGRRGVISANKIDNIICQ